MNLNKKRISLILIFLLVFSLLFSACQKPGNDEFLAFIDRVFLDEVASDTLSLHYTLAYPEDHSIKTYPITFGGIGEQHRKDDLKVTKSYRDELLSFNYDSLDRKNKITYDTFLWSLEADLSAAKFEYYDEFLNPTTGLQAQMPVLLAEYAFRTEKDVADYLELISQLDEYYGEIVKYQREKSAAGLFMADYTLDAIIEQCGDLIKDRERHFLIVTFEARIDALEFLTEEQKNGYKAANISALNDHVFPAYQLLMEGLDDLRGTGTNDKGLCYFPSGKEYYSYLVKVSTGSDKTVPELMDMTSTQMQYNITEIRALAQDAPDLFDRLEVLDSLEKEDPAEILEQLRHSMSEHYPAPPDVNYEVKYVDPSLEDHLSPAFFLVPPIDLYTENTIYVNQASSGINDPAYFFSVMAHEGYPGHLYQKVYTAASQLDKLRYLLYFPGYTEGYATYAEKNSYIYLGVDPAVAEFLRINDMYTLGIYASVDMGVNYEGWSVEYVHDYLESNFGISDTGAATKMFQSVVADPANYLKYYIGCLEIMELKEKAKTAKGADFSLIDFHDDLLSIGSAPFSVLEKYILE